MFSIIKKRSLDLEARNKYLVLKTNMTNLTKFLNKKREEKIRNGFLKIKEHS